MHGLWGMPPIISNGSLQSMTRVGGKRLQCPKASLLGVVLPISCWNNDCKTTLAALSSKVREYPQDTYRYHVPYQGDTTPLGDWTVRPAAVGHCGCAEF